MNVHNNYLATYMLTFHCIFSLCGIPLLSIQALVIVGTYISMPVHKIINVMHVIHGSVHNETIVTIDFIRI